MGKSAHNKFYVKIYFLGLKNSASAKWLNTQMGQFDSVSKIFNKTIKRRQIFFFFQLIELINFHIACVCSAEWEVHFNFTKMKLKRVIHCKKSNYRDSSNSIKPQQKNLRCRRRFHSICKLFSNLIWISNYGEWVNKIKILFIHIHKR